MTAGQPSVTKFVLRELRATRARALILGTRIAFGERRFQRAEVGIGLERGRGAGDAEPELRAGVRHPGATGGSRAPLESSDGLINAGFLSDLYGGISLRQWRAILRLGGVAVAAPVVNVGYTLMAIDTSISLRSVVGSAAQQVFRVVPTWSVHGGLASYPDPAEY